MSLVFDAVLHDLLFVITPSALLNTHAWATPLAFKLLTHFLNFGSLFSSALFFSSLWQQNSERELHCLFILSSSRVPIPMSWLWTRSPVMPASLISISLSTLLFLLEASAVLLTWFSSYLTCVSFSVTLLLLLLPLIPINAEVNTLVIYYYIKDTPKMWGSQTTNYYTAILQ